MDEQDDRRNRDVVRLKERLAVVEAKQSDQEKIVSGMNYALFGIPQDPTNHGLVGTVHEVKAQLANANKYLIATLVTSLAAIVVRFIH